MERKEGVTAAGLGGNGQMVMLYTLGFGLWDGINGLLSGRLIICAMLGPALQAELAVQALGLRRAIFPVQTLSPLCRVVSGSYFF
jgi:hypothetical protein